MIDLNGLKRISQDSRKWGSAPGPLDLATASALSGLSAADTYWSIRKEVDLKLARMLNAFARRAAATAVGSKDPEWIRHGLRAAQLAMLGEDGREILRTYALLFRASQLAGQDAKALFTEHSVVLGEAETLEEFANRAAADQTVECMGFVEERMPDGSVRWRSRWP